MDSRSLKPLFVDDYRTLLWSIAFLLYGIFLDMGSTVAGELLFPLSTFESNWLLVDKAGKYLPLKYLFLNSAGIGFLLIPLSVALGLAFRRWSFATLPFWLAGAHFAEVGAQNILLMFHLLYQRL